MTRSGSLRRPAGPPVRSFGRFRRSAQAVALGALVASSGCATKRDVAELRTEVLALEARQDSLFTALELQNLRQSQLVLDSLQANNLLLLRVRGDLARQLIQIEQQLIQIQELTGQSQRRIAELQAAAERRSELLANAVPTAAAPGDTLAGTEAAADGTPEQLYGIGTDQLQRGAASVARMAFAQIVQQYSTHPIAPDAQFYLAETYVAEEDFDTALREFERVVEMFPSSSRAPNALFRAGVIAEERGNIAQAREYFNRVVAGYPTSDEAGPSRDRLRRLQN